VSIVLERLFNHSQKALGQKNSGNLWSVFSNPRPTALRSRGA